MSPRFPSSWLDELYQRADIVQVVSSYTHLKRNGQRYIGLCPFHHEKTPSFSVNPQLNLFHCFGCKAGGNIVQFVMEMEKLSFYDAAKSLAEQCNLPLPIMDELPDYQLRQSQKERMWEMNKLAAHFYHQHLYSIKGQEVLSYFYQRGLDDGIIKRFGLGASPSSWGELLQFLTEKGFTKDEMQAAGLIVQKPDTAFDFFRNRAMFPIIDKYGNVVAFGGRAMGDAQPKYLNTSETLVFNKRKGLYAINLLKRLRNLSRIILVEGYMDVIALSQAGVQGVVATLGTALTNEQAQLMKRYAPQIWVAYDGDEAGQKAIEKSLDIFEQEAVDVRVKFLPDRLDPDEYIRQHGQDSFETLLPMQPVAYRIMRLEQHYDLSETEDKVEFAKQCAKILQKVKQPVDLEMYLRDLVIKTGFEREILLAQMGITSPLLQKSKSQSNPYTRGQPKQEGSKAEQTLVSLLGTGALPAGMVQLEDIKDELLKRFVALLLSGKSPASIVAETEQEQERQIATKVFTYYNGEQPQNAVQMASDCLRVLRLAKLEEQGEQLSRQLSVVSEPDKRQLIMQEIMSLNVQKKQLKERQGLHNREV